MKIKGILRFYFSVESLESAFEKLILARACLPFADADKNAEKILAIIESKKEMRFARGGKSAPVRFRGAESGRGTRDERRKERGRKIYAPRVAP